MAALNSTCFAAAFFTPRDYRLPSRQTTITLHLHRNCGRTPMMTSRACLDPDQSFGQSGKERDDLGAAQSPAQHASTLGISAVHLEDVLGDVEADHGRIGHVTSFELPAQS